MKWLSYDETYSVSEEGYVMNHKTGKILFNQDDRRGYDRVDINGKHRKVHQLVAARFLPAPTEEGLIIDHIDRDRRNNHASNLRWATRSVNNSNRSAPLCSSCKCRVGGSKTTPHP
jgi:hypothetical protein